MQTKTLETNVRHLKNSAIIDLSGEIDGFAEQALNEAYEEAESQNPPSILLNFNNVDYINSTGIALIVSLLSRARKSERKISTFGLSDHYVEIFHITRLADFMGIYPDEVSALAGIS